MSVVVCTGLWGKELHRQVGMGIVVTAGSLHGEIVVAHWPGMPEILLRFMLSAQYFHPKPPTYIVFLFTYLLVIYD